MNPPTFEEAVAVLRERADEESVRLLADVAVASSTFRNRVIAGDIEWIYRRDPGSSGGQASALLVDAQVAVIKRACQLNGYTDAVTAEQAAYMRMAGFREDFIAEFVARA